MRTKEKGRRTRGRSTLVVHPLSPPGHAVYELAPGLLLVFKPRGHREAMHAHAHAQRLRVLRGRLEVRTARGAVRIDASARPLRIAAGRAHATRACADTWLIAERLTAESGGPRVAGAPASAGRGRRRAARA